MGELTIGYGSGGGQPLRFVLQQHQNEEVGQLKFLLLDAAH